MSLPDDFSPVFASLLEDFLFPDSSTASSDTHSSMPSLRSPTPNLGPFMAEPLQRRDPRTGHHDTWPTFMGAATSWHSDAAATLGSIATADGMRCNNCIMIGIFCMHNKWGNALLALRVYRDMRLDSLPTADERHLFLAQFYKDCQGAFALFDRRMERLDRIEFGHRLIFDSMDWSTIRGLLDPAYSASVPVRIRSMIGKDCLTPGQESILLDIEKAVKSAHFSDVAHHRCFLDIQAKRVLKYRRYLYTFAVKRHIGEVVFTLRIAYQAINTRLEPNPPGSYFNDICNFITEIVRERAAHAERVRLERERKAQSHRQEMQDVRDAAEALQKLKKGNRTKATVVVSDGDQSDDHSDTGSVVYVKAKSKDPVVKDASSKDPSSKDPLSKDPTTGEAADAMAIDEPTKLDRQLGLIERMVDFLQLDSGLAVPKVPNNTVSPIDNGPNELAVDADAIDTGVDTPITTTNTFSNEFSL
ncbi:hypothetical protein GGX14DRAFT_580789 [Mycena pura]|uniref:Uncharacterized protein n=1 Tax=Mycena pura TaxID=153505 RepID=A0AAD6Y2Z1_9AGAR|nr:hypothetical protein GGX14DRAFT_580789 [Mycena pura]